MAYFDFNPSGGRPAGLDGATGQMLYMHEGDDPNAAPPPPPAGTKYGAQGPGSWVDGKWVPSTNQSELDAFLSQGTAGNAANQDRIDNPQKYDGVNVQDTYGVSGKTGAQGNGYWQDDKFVQAEPDGFGGWIVPKAPQAPAAPVDPRTSQISTGYANTVDFLRNLFHNDTAFDKYRPEINNELDLFARSMGNFSNVTGDDINKISTNYYGADRAQSIYDSLLARHRGQWGSTATLQFGPNRAMTDLPDTADDDIIAKILGEQRPLAEQQIGYAQKRGQLSDRGAGLAMGKLNTKQTELTSTLNNQGSTLLNAIRGKLNTIGGNAKTGAAGADFSNEFDPSQYETEWSNTLNSEKAGLEGSLRGLTTPDEFGVRDLIGYGGANQGPVNNPTFLLDAIQKQKKARSTQRGLGTQGEF